MAFAERDRALASTSQLAPLQAALAEAQAAAAGAAAGAAEWQDKFMNERAVRRKLHEQLQVRVDALLMHFCILLASSFATSY